MNSYCSESGCCLKCPVLMIVSERPQQLSLKIRLAHVIPLRPIHCGQNKGDYENRTNLWQRFLCVAPQPGELLP